ncbi:MAG: hypothetical protein HKL81_08775 [Acidimicrobiaceae bacterium]|nr:hypothetical protein [Acidimicrobiaceae bacterium]
MKHNLLRAFPVILIGALGAVDLYLNSDQLGFGASGSTSFLVKLLILEAVTFVALPAVLSVGLRRLGEDPEFRRLLRYSVVLVCLLTVGEMFTNRNPLSSGIWVPSLAFALLLVELWSSRAFRGRSVGVFSNLPNFPKRSSGA